MGGFFFGSLLCNQFTYSLSLFDLLFLLRAPLSWRLCVDLAWPGLISSIMACMTHEKGEKALSNNEIIKTGVVPGPKLDYILQASQVTFT